MRKSTRLPLDQLAPYLLDLPDPLIPLDWQAFFGSAAPVEIEIGCGKGLFLLSAALAHADVNFVGVEIQRKYHLYTANRIAKRGLKNVRLVCADAKAFLRDAVLAGSVQAIHVYFPDPWWKKRHQKRRLFSADFVRECARVLRPGGNLLVATDVEEYFTAIAQLLAEQRTLRSLPPTDAKDPQHDLDYLTNFERKKRQAGLPIYRGEWQRVQKTP